MTSSWNDFSLGKLDSKESTPQPGTPPLGTTLNLANLAPAESPAAARPAAPGNNSLMDAGTGFVQGMGKQAIGTLDSIFGVDNALLKKNIAAGGSGSTAEGMGWVPAAGKLIHGVSSTVSLAYHNPDALLAIPGQLSQQWNSGDLKTRADMAGQATFLIGSLFVGGSGAAKAGNIAGDLREASVVSKGLNTLSETGATMRGLETTVTGLRGSTLVGDASTLGRTSSLIGDASTLGRTSSLMGDAANLTRTSALVGDGTALTEAGLLARSGTALDQTAATFIKTGSFGEKVLPATEGATKFLVRGGETASTLGLGEMSMPNRLLGLQSTEQGAGVVSKFLERFRPAGASEVETALSGTVQNIPKFGRGTLAGDLTTGSKVADVTGDASRLTTLTNDAAHLTGDAGRLAHVTGEGGSLGNLTTEAGRLTTGVTSDASIAGKLNGVSTEIGAAGKVTGLTTDVGTAGKVTGVSTEVGAGKLTGASDELANAGRVTHLPPEAGHVPGLTHEVPGLTPLSDATKLAGGVSDARVVESVNGLGRTTAGAEHLVTSGAAKVEGLPGAIGDLNRAGRVGETIAPQALNVEHTVQAAEQLAPHVSQFAEQTNLLRTTGNLGSRSETALTELESGLTKFKAAGNVADRAESLGQLNRALNVLEQQGVETTALRTTLTNLQTETAAVERVSQLRTATAQIAEHSSTLSSQTVELTTQFGERASVQNLELATKQFAQAGNAAERAQALSAVEKATAQVAADLPAEASAALRSTVESLKAPVQIAAKSEAAEVVATQIADRSATLGRQVADLTSTSASPAVRELDMATKQLAQAGNATERAQAFAAVEKASAKVISEVPAEAGNALRTTVESLRTPVQAAARSEIAEVAATQIAERSSVLTEHATELAAKYGTRTSVQDLSTATRQFNEAATATEKVQALGAVERASARVANEIPEAGAALRSTVESLRAPVQAAAKVEQTELIAAQITERSGQLTAETASLARNFADNPAVRDMTTATREFNQATNAVERAEAYAKMEKAANAVRELSPEGAQVARTVESLGAPVESAARAQRIETAVAQVEERVSSLSAQTKTLAQEVAVEGKVPASVRELDAATTRMQQATTATEKAEAYAAVQKSATEVAAEFPAKSTQISKTVESIAPHIESAERLTQFENVSSRVAYHADDIAKEASLLKATATAPLKSEAALTELQTSASTFKAATATERSEQLAQMNRNLKLVEAEVGEAKVAGLRTSVARLENEAGTLDRMATVEKSVAQVGERSQSVVRTVADLETKVTSDAARISLENIKAAVTESGAGNVLNRTEQLSLRSKDIATIEREMGTAAGGQVRQAIADLDRSTVAARTNAIDLVEYQGAKIQQQLGYLEEGRLGSRVQSLRIEQLEHDVAVMKSVVPTDSAVAPHLLKLEGQIKGVDAIANILAHPEVARAPGRELLKLAESADAATATAAADRIILSGKSIEKLGDGPVTGLISERAQFWNSQRKLTELEDTVKTKLFESGKLFGMPVSEPIFKKTLADIAMATGGILTLDGVAAYNLNKIAAMARDNVLSAQAEAQARKDNQPKKEAEATTDAGSQSAQTAASQAAAANQPATNNTAGVNTPGAQASSKALDNQGSDNYVRTAQQVVFKNDAQDAKMSPAMQVYGTPKFLPADDRNNLPAGSFPTAGSSWWWKQQHGGNPWGFNRGPGAPVVAQEEVKQTVQITPRARGIAATPDQDLTKIAQVRFPIPRVMDISNQAMLLNSPNQFTSRSGRPGSFGGAGGASKTWTTVDWSQIGSHRVAATEGGKGNQDLSKLEKDEELGIDGSGGGVVAGQSGPINIAQNVSHSANDPTAADPNDPNAVVATSSQPTPGDDNLAKV